ncbi:MAG: hypothetical protein MZV64_42825 [Ignavibacteriales bacterium]|nr:hypothetical protein [Ignavibacteriales bacterium]
MIGVSGMAASMPFLEIIGQQELHARARERRGTRLVRKHGHLPGIVEQDEVERQRVATSASR